MAMRIRAHYARITTCEAHVVAYVWQQGQNTTKMLQHIVDSALKLLCAPIAATNCHEMWQNTSKYAEMQLNAIDQTPDAWIHH